MHYYHYFPQLAIPPLQYSRWSAEGAILRMAIKESHRTHLFYIWLCFMENINFSVRQIPSQELVGGKNMFQKVTHGPQNSFHYAHSHSFCTNINQHVRRGSLTTSAIKQGRIGMRSVLTSGT